MMSPSEARNGDPGEARSARRRLRRRARAPIVYRDFSLKITPGEAGAFQCFVLESPAGTGHGPYTPPFSRVEAEEVRKELCQRVLASGRHVRPVAPAAVEPRKPEKIGDELFRALLSGRVGDLYHHSRGQVEHHPLQGIRLRLRLDLDDPEVAWLGGLPWEYLYRVQTREFIALDPWISVTRSLDIARPAKPRAQAQFRILVVLSSAEDLGGAKEYARLEAAWKLDPAVELKVLKRATLADLRTEIEAEGLPLGVLHFIGHATFDEQSGRGSLLFKDEDRREQAVSGDQLATILKAHRDLRLVVLNACETASFPLQNGLDPFAGVATALLMAGVPAVVAMQCPISDEAAVEFSDSLYDYLAAGHSIDRAVAEGRRTLSLGHDGTPEWGTPVLYLQTKDGDLFERPGLLVRILRLLVRRWVVALAAALLLLAIISALPSICCKPDCDGIRISRVEVDLPGGSRALELGNHRVTRLQDRDLQGLQHLSGRAVLSGGSRGCSCMWMGRTDQETTMRRIDEPMGACGFDIELTPHATSVFLQLTVGEQSHLFTLTRR